MSVILSQTFMCRRCRLLAPVSFGSATPDGLLCGNCVPSEQQQQQRNDEGEAWLIGVLHDDSEEDDEDARAGVEPAATNEKKL